MVAGYFYYLYKDNFLVRILNGSSLKKEEIKLLNQEGELFHSIYPFVVVVKDPMSEERHIIEDFICLNTSEIMEKMYDNYLTSPVSVYDVDATSPKHSYETYIDICFDRSILHGDRDNPLLFTGEHETLGYINFPLRIQPIYVWFDKHEEEDVYTLVEPANIIHLPSTSVREDAIRHLLYHFRVIPLEFYNGEDVTDMLEGLV